MVSCIRTSQRGKGGFVNYDHLKRDIKNYLTSSSKNDFIVTMLVDFFRSPKLPHSERYEGITDHISRVKEMEQCIKDYVSDSRFIPYIQLHEFEALLYSSNKGFEDYFSDKEMLETKKS